MILDYVGIGLVIAIVAFIAWVGQNRLERDR